MGEKEKAGAEKKLENEERFGRIVVARNDAARAYRSLRDLEVMDLSSRQLEDAEAAIKALRAFRVSMARR